jgi:hypothetical protein
MGGQHPPVARVSGRFLDVKKPAKPTGLRVSGVFMTRCIDWTKGAAKRPGMLRRTKEKAPGFPGAVLLGA